VFAGLGEARRAVHLRLTSKPETVPGQKSASRRSPLISSKPVYGRREEALKVPGITSALPTTQKYLLALPDVTVKIN